MGQAARCILVEAVEEFPDVLFPGNAEKAGARTISFVRLAWLLSRGNARVPRGVCAHPAYD